MSTTWETLLKSEGWRSDYPSVEKFLKYYSRKTGSEHTRKNSLQTLSLLCEAAKLDPDRLASLQPKEASETIQDMLDSMKQKGRSIRYLNVTLAYIKTFYKVNGYKNDKSLEVDRYYQPSRYRKTLEYIPTSEEILRMCYASGSLKNRALILATYTSGLRNSTLRALLYRDIKQDIASKEIVMIPVYPEMKNADSDACKGNIPYYTFISREATQTLKEYLQERGHVKDDEPVFCSDSTNIPEERRRKTLVKMGTLQIVVKRAAKGAGIEKWKSVYPHCLRKAYESALRNSGLDTKDQEFLMGHILPGSQDTYYDKTKVEELRAKYSRVNFFPQSIEGVKKEAVLEALRRFAETFGVDPMKVKIEKQKEGGESNVDQEIQLLQNEIKKKKDSQDSSENIRPFTTKKVTEKQLDQAVEEGWEIVREVSGGKILVKKTNGIH